MNEEFRANVEKWNAAWSGYNEKGRELSWDPSSKIDSFVNSNGTVSTLEFAYFIVEMRAAPRNLPTINFILDRINVNDFIRDAVPEVKTAESLVLDWLSKHFENSSERRSLPSARIAEEFFEAHPELALNPALKRLPPSSELKLHRFRRGNNI